MINLPLNELKLMAKIRSVKDYKNKFEEDLIKILSEPKPKINLSKKIIKQIKKDFSRLRYGFSKSKINQFRGSLYNIKNIKNLSAPEIKETEKNLFELEKSLSSLKRYYDYGDTENQGIGDIKNLFNEFDEDYYKPIKTKSAFNGNYIEYESKGDKDKNLSPKEYLDMIRPYLSDMINDNKAKRDWKIQLTMSINFIFSKDFGETRNLHIKSNNIEIMMGNETIKDEITEKLFGSLLQNYQKDLEESMRGSEFNFNSVGRLYYHLQKISLIRGRSYIDSPEWLENKKATIKPKNNDVNCFQYALTVALNYQNIKKAAQRISKVKSFINRYNWKEINFPSHLKDWKKFEQNNKTVVLNILLVPYNTEKIRLACKSKHNLKRKNQVILLMITDGKKWHYLAIKSVPVLLREITSNQNGDSYRTKKKLKKHEKVGNNHDYCYVEMPNEDKKILSYYYRENSLKVSAYYLC